MDMDSLIERMPVIQGCYLLTAGGELGAYREDRSFVIDAGLSQAVAVPIRSLPRALHADPGFRVLPDRPDLYRPSGQTLAFRNPGVRQRCVAAPVSGVQQPSP